MGPKQPAVTREARACVLGAGVTGLAAALTLDRHDVYNIIVEAADAVGGLARTIERNGFRFDLGGHRFFTKNEAINRLVDDLMGDEMIDVERKSSIYYNRRFFDYPLRIPNVLANLGLFRSARVLADFAWTRTKRIIKPRPAVSVQDWMVDQFGETLYDLFFRSYTAKVWGLPGDQLSQEWAGQRIRGFSLPSAIKHAILTSPESKPKTLIDRFRYPRLGIGRLSERMAEEIDKNNHIYLRTRVQSVNHDGKRITSVEFNNSGTCVRVIADHYISSIPLTVLLSLMNPPPPPEITAAAAQITFRGLAIVHLALNRPTVTDQTWIYIQEPSSVVSRIHEPKNWSASMVPESKTSLVVEIPCSPGDAIWQSSDEDLRRMAVESLEKELGFIREDEVSDFCVIRLPKAYPVYHLGYEAALTPLIEHVRRFTNIQTVGRAGLHKYVNIDHCLECGILAARNVLGAAYDLRLVNSEKEYLEEAAS